MKAKVTAFNKDGTQEVQELEIRDNKELLSFSLELFMLKDVKRFEIEIEQESS